MIRFFLLLFICTSAISLVNAQSASNIWSIDFVKCQGNHREEMVYYYQNNWKVFRDSMLERGLISAYAVLETKADSLGRFDLILMTGYPDSLTWKKSEDNFRPIIKAIRPESNLLLNGVKAAEFRALQFFKTAHTLFASPNLPAINIDPSPIATISFKEINRDIWQPFMEAYRSKKPEQYIALHAPDFIRASGGKSLHTSDLAQYAQSVRKSFLRFEKELQVAISFSFFERTASKNTASERGIYRLTYIKADGTKEQYYGRFHVFLRKINGKWKIAVDYDTDDGEMIGETQFEAGKGLMEF